MPYIEESLRDKVDMYISGLASTFVTNSDLREKREGVINYIVTRLIIKLYHVSYSELCKAIGTLICVCLELYRRKLAPYEDEKMKEHGDVY